jgi:hypothetical protein
MQVAKMLTLGILGRRGTTPLSLSGCQLWLDFMTQANVSQDTAGATPVVAPGDIVGRVIDRSANANHFIQSGITQKPLWYADGVLFDGVNDVLAGGNSGLNFTSRTIIVVFVPTSVDTGARVIFGAGTNYYVGRTGSSALVSWNNTIPVQKTASGPSLTAAIKTIYLARWTTNGVNVDALRRINAVEQNNSYTDGHQTPSSSSFFVGAINSAGTLASDVKIRHIIAYNRALSGSEILQLETIL